MVYTLVRIFTTYSITKHRSKIYFIATTKININSLGLIVGFILTFTGEILGAFIGFYLYRWGFSKVHSKWFNHTFLRL